MNSKTDTRYPEHVLMVVRRRLGLDPEDPSLDQEIQAMPARDVAEHVLQNAIGRSLGAIERAIQACGGTIIWKEEKKTQ